MTKSISEKEKLGQDYTNECAKAGDLQYRILALQNALNQCNGRLAELNRRSIEMATEKVQVEAEKAIGQEVAATEVEAQL